MEVLDIAGTTTPLSYTERGDGHVFLVLHGGGGPQTVTGFADLLAAEHRARVITPVHPGFGGTARPVAFTTVGQLARLYLADPDYGRALAGAIPDAEFVLLTEAGHLPQLESPKRLVPAIWDFAAAHARNRPPR